MSTPIFNSATPAQTVAPGERDATAVAGAHQSELLQQTLAELAQTKRELQIEAALERIRARAMEMHQSFELSDVLSVLFEQYDILGIRPVFSHLTLFDVKNKKFSFRTTGRDGRRVQAEQKIDIDAIDAWKDAVENWRRGGPNLVHSHMYPKEILPQVFALFQEILSVIPEEARFYPEDFPNGVFITQGYCKYGYIGFGHFREATEEEKEVVRRMATEFERLYQRFLDLQKTEHQIREAQIEAALERVRAGALAMRSSDDVGNATGMLFSELDKLGISILRCGIYIVDEHEKTMQVWRATTTADGTIGQAAGKVSMMIHPMLATAYNYWLRKEPFFSYRLEGADLSNYYNALARHAPQFAQNVPKEPQTSSSFHFSEGALFTFSSEPLDEPTKNVLKKFAAVFGLTYRRFLDLKIAEAQAKESMKQASLDRVRAETASMRTSGDLEKITPLIWTELTRLGVPFIRCGVFIMDDLHQIIHTYLSTPEGRAIAAFNLPYNTPGNIPQVVEHWRKKTIFSEFWDEGVYVEYASSMVEQGAFRSPEQYIRTLPEGGFYLYFIPFLQGMIYVGNSTQLEDQKIELIQAVADAFSTAYARYEDFNKLETAKQQVDQTLLDLRQTQQQLIQAEKMASLGQLTAGIAHEIQNPLNFVNNFSETNKELIEELHDELAAGHKMKALAICSDIKENEEKISHHGRRAENIVRGMLQHARTTAGKKEAVDVNRLADEYLRISYQGNKVKYKTLTAKLEMNFDETIGEIQAVPQDLGQVLLNLFNNAFYAIWEKKKYRKGKFEPIVSVTTQKQPDKIIITVQDNGTGMSPNVAAKAFQPFFTTKPAGEGTGLGLSLSYDIITKGHSGSLQVSSTEGEGSVFVIELPVSQLS